MPHVLQHQSLINVLLLGFRCKVSLLNWILVSKNLSADFRVFQRHLVVVAPKLFLFKDCTHLTFFELRYGPIDRPRVISVKYAEIRIVPYNFVPIVIVIGSVVLKWSIRRGRLVSIPTRTWKCNVASDWAMDGRALPLLVDSTLSVVFDERRQLLIYNPWVLLLWHHLVNYFVSVFLDRGVTRTSIQLRLWSVIVKLLLVYHFYISWN